MTDPLPVTLDLYIEGDADDAAEQLASVPEVASVDSVETTSDRDLATIATTIVSITAIVSNASTLAATVDQLIANLSALAKKLPRWKKVSLAVGRKTVDIHDFTPEQQDQLRQQLLAQHTG